jgi:hypothetical protein
VNTNGTTDHRRAGYIQGLREIADWLEQHPDVKLPWLGDDELDIYVYGDIPAEMAAIARAMGVAEKGSRSYRSSGEERFTLTRQFGALRVVASCPREEVCERVVTGTEEVTEEVPDPAYVAAAPTVTVTKVVEQVEWVCRPLLAEDREPAGATR